MLHSAAPTGPNGRHTATPKKPKVAPINAPWFPASMNAPDRQAVRSVHRSREPRLLGDGSVGVSVEDHCDACRHFAGRRQVQELVGAMRV